MLDQNCALIVLAGGNGQRLGGIDKAEISIGRVTLLEHALAAGAGAGRAIVVGPPRQLPAGVLSSCEDPPGGGPVAALAAGLALVVEPVVVVLACDMPLLSAATIDNLVVALDAPGPLARLDRHEVVDAVLLVDANRRRQPLAAAYRTAALRAALAALPTVCNASMRALVSLLTVSELSTHPEQTLDCDTWADVERTRHLLEEES